jgi:hypothetical protein
MTQEDMKDELEFNVSDVAYFPKTALQVLLRCMFGETSNIDFVRLDSRK